MLLGVRLDPNTYNPCILFGAQLFEKSPNHLLHPLHSSSAANFHQKTPRWKSGLRMNLERYQVTLIRGKGSDIMGESKVPTPPMPPFLSAGNKALVT